LEEMANGVLQMMPLKLTDGVRRHGVLLCKFTECPTGCNGSFNMHGASKTGYTDADVYRGIEKAPKTLRGSSGSLHIRKLSKNERKIKG